MSPSPQQPPIVVEYTVNAEHGFSSMQAALGRPKLLLLVVYAIVMGGAMAATGGYLLNQERPAAGVVMLVLGLATATAPLWMRLLIASSYAMVPLAKRNQRWTISMDGLHRRVDDGEVRFDWSLIANVLETHEGFYLSVSREVKHWLPKRAFADAGSIDRFRQLLQQHGVAIRTAK